MEGIRVTGSVFVQFLRWARRRAVRNGVASVALLLGVPVILSAQSVSFTEYPISNGYLDQIAAGPDGAMWFTELTGNKIGRISTAGVVTEYAIPTPGSNPIGIAAGPDGALWFAEYLGNKIGRIKLQVTPAWTTVKVCPATVTVPVRPALNAFDATK
jgi:streptogramin lyase